MIQDEVTRHLGRLLVYDATHMSYCPFKMIGLFNNVWESKNVSKMDDVKYSMIGCVLFTSVGHEWVPKEYFDCRHLFYEDVQYLREPTTLETLQTIKYVKRMGRRYCHKKNWVLTLFTIKQIKRKKRNGQSN